MFELTFEQAKEASACLNQPFDPALVDFRIVNFSEAAPNRVVDVLAYADARAYQAVLNKAYTPLGWDFRVNILQTAARKLQLGKESVACDVPISGIGILTLPGGTVHEGYGEASNIEPGKGLWSDCLKMCATQAGVGQCLYNLPRMTARLDADKSIPNSEVERLRAALAAYWGVTYTPRPVDAFTAPVATTASTVATSDAATRQAPRTSHPSQTQAARPAGSTQPTHIAEGRDAAMSQGLREQITNLSAELHTKLPEGFETYTNGQATEYLKKLRAYKAERAEKTQKATRAG